MAQASVEADAATTTVLTREERWAYEQRCDRVLCDAIAAFAGYDGSMDARQWRELQRRDQLTVYRGVDGSSTTRAVDGQRAIGVTSSAAGWIRLVGTGYVHGRIEDVTNALYCDSDDELVHNETILSGAIVLDGAVLQATETKGPRTPFRFAGVKWYAIQCGGEPRDLLTYERMGMTLDSDNTEVAYHIVHSISKHSDWPHALPRSGAGVAKWARAPHGLRRLEPFTMCYLYRKVSEDLVQCFVVSDYSSKLSSRSQQYTEAAIVDRILMISNTVACSEAKILTDLLEDCQDTPVQMNKTCRRCKTRRSVIDPLRVCGICRKSVCVSCRVMKVVSHLNQNTKLPETEAFCTICLRRVNISSNPTTAPIADRTNGAHSAQVQLEEYHSVQQREDIHQRAQIADKERGDRRGRRHISVAVPRHNYNYDELLRNRGGVVPAPPKIAVEASKSKERSKPRSKESRLNISLGRDVFFHNRQPSCESTNSSEDLYLSASNNASGEAERQYRRYLDRRRTLDLESIRGIKKESTGYKSGTGHQSANRRNPSARSEGAQAVAPKTVCSQTVPRSANRVSANTAIESRSKKNEFYRDLYTEL